MTLPLATSKLKHLIQCRELYGKSALAMENASKKKALEEVDGRKIVRGINFYSIAVIYM